MVVKYKIEGLKKIFWEQKGQLWYWGIKSLTEKRVYNRPQKNGKESYIHMLVEKVIQYYIKI